MNYIRAFMRCRTSLAYNVQLKYTLNVYGYILIFQHIRMFTVMSVNGHMTCR